MFDAKVCLWTNILCWQHCSSPADTNPETGDIFAQIRNFGKNKKLQSSDKRSVDNFMLLCLFFVHESVVSNITNTYILIC